MVVEGMKCSGGGGGGVNGGQVVVDDDMGDGMQCSDHPYRNNPGGICAFCLQEKLGKLVSSSFPLPIRASSSAASSTSSPNSFRSDCLNSKNDAVLNDCRFYNADEYYATTNARAARPRNGSITNNGNGSNNNNISFLLNVVLAKKKKKVGVVTASSGSSSSTADHVVLKRSKSTTMPRRGRGGGRFLEASDDFSPRKRGGFWAFLYLSSSFASTKKGFANGESSKTASFSSVTSAGLAVKPKERRPDRERERERETASSVVVLEENDSPNSQATASASSFERKVSRSRSVGCGSRSFSGDFFERISTGFGDCTLRRVESQREGNGAGKPKSSATSSHHGGGEHHCMKERVKCGGIFGGFILTSSSSASSSSSYWVSSADDVNGPKHVAGGPGPLAHGRIRSWGWAFASPMRAFGKPSGSNGKRDIIRQASDKNSSASATTTTTPNLAAIPSLLAVRG